jgi:hypothetical protein
MVVIRRSLSIVEDVNATFTLLSYRLGCMVLLMNPHKNVDNKVIWEIRKPSIL